MCVPIQFLGQTANCWFDQVHNRVRALLLPFQGLLTRLTFFRSSGEVTIPILAQRLLINMRKIDYMGSQPIASKLLFAPATGPDSDELEDEMNTFELAQEGSRPCHQMLADEAHAKKDAGGATHSFA